MHDEVTSCGISDYGNEKRKLTGNEIDKDIVSNGNDELIINRFNRVLFA